MFDDARSQRRRERAGGAWDQAFQRGRSISSSQCDQSGRNCEPHYTGQAGFACSVLYLFLRPPCAEAVDSGTPLKLAAILWNYFENRLPDSSVVSANTEIRLYSVLCIYIYRYCI